MEKVFGTMLDAGATSFWEVFDSTQKDVDRYSFYGCPWAKSLCHAWSAWPAVLFVSEAMKLKPTSDSWATFKRWPIPSAEKMRATAAFPNGG